MMHCPKCQTEIPDGITQCPKCGSVVSKVTGEKWDLGIWSLLLTSLSLIPYIPLIREISEITIIGLILIFLVLFAMIGQVTALLSIIGIKREKAFGSRLIYPIMAILIGIFTIWGPFTMDRIRGFKAAQIRSKVSRVKEELRTISTALNNYYIDNSSYPLPDIDENGKTILPKSLTTPIAFITTLFQDQFKNDGKRYYEYGSNGRAFIIASYGPDHVDGNLGTPGGTILDESKAVTDETLGFPLHASGLSYDPTNGITSGGDIWRRGPIKNRWQDYN